MIWFLAYKVFIGFMTASATGSHIISHLPYLFP